MNAKANHETAVREDLERRRVWSLHGFVALGESEDDDVGALVPKLASLRVRLRYRKGHVQKTT